MIRRVVKKIGSGLQSFGHFFAAFSHTKKQSSAPDPRKAAAKRVRDAMHVTRGNTGFSTSGANEKIYGQVLSEGHRQRH